MVLRVYVIISSACYSLCDICDRMIMYDCRKNNTNHMKKIVYMLYNANVKYFYLSINKLSILNFFLKVTILQMGPYNTKGAICSYNKIAHNVSL